MDENLIEKEEIDNYKKEINNLNLKTTELNRNKEKDFLTYATSIANLDVMLNSKSIEMNKLEKENNSIKSQIDDLKKLIIEKEQKIRDSNIKITNIKKNLSLKKIKVPLTASEKEINKNIRSRSAKIRVAERI